MKLIPFIILILLGFDLYAENVHNLITVGAAEFVLPEGWHHEKEVNAGRLTVNIYHPDSQGVLKLSAMKLPAPTSRERLRNLTNVDASIIVLPGTSAISYISEIVETRPRSLTNGAKSLPENKSGNLFSIQNVAMMISTVFRIAIPDFLRVR